MIWIALGLGICGLFLSAFFSGSETGFYRATRLRLVLDAMAGDRIARGLLFLTNHAALFVATALVGNSVANYLISLATVIAMGRVFPLVPEAAEIIASLVLAPIVLVYGELLPKNLFLQAPNRLLRRGGGLFLFFVVLFFPLAGLLWLLGRLLARQTRSSQEPVRLVLAQRELRRILAEGHGPAYCTPPSRVSRMEFWLSPASRSGSFSRRRARWCRSGPTGKQAVLHLAQRSHTAVSPSPTPPGGWSAMCGSSICGCTKATTWLPSAPCPRCVTMSLISADSMRLESTGDSLARVVNVRGETVGIVTLERLREPLF